MAKNAKLTINGYVIPGGKGGLAVRRACELIVKTPGIKQTDLLEVITEFARLNTSTASWITSPSSKGKASPSTALWERRKEGRGFRCYPNEFTHQLGDSEILKIEDLVRDAVEATCRIGWDPRPSWIDTIKPGALVRFEQMSGPSGAWPPETGIFLGWSFKSGSIFGHPNDLLGRVDTGVQFARHIYPVVLFGGAPEAATSAWIRLAEDN